MKKRLIVAGAALASVALLQPYRPFVVSGTSMTPTFKSGQVLLANVRPHELSRGEVVVFRHDGETLVKRIAYLPNDSIQQFWFVGEWQLPTSRVMLRAMRHQHLPKKEVVVPAGHVYVLADYPYGSIDSRTFGPIPDSEIVAVVPNVDRSAENNIDGAHEGSALVASL